jgi:hypothetical protein
MEADGMIDGSEFNSWEWAFFIAVCQMLALSIGAHSLT